MASVHESLYFNPMMTNGVVHANVFGIKDWVTPYKISVLVLLVEMVKSKRMALIERRRLNKLILPLQQVRLCLTPLREMCIKISLNSTLLLQIEVPVWTFYRCRCSFSRNVILIFVSDLHARILPACFGFWLFAVFRHGADAKL